MVFKNSLFPKIQFHKIHKTAPIFQGKVVPTFTDMVARIWLNYWLFLFLKIQRKTYIFAINQRIYPASQFDRKVLTFGVCPSVFPCTGNINRPRCNHGNKHVLFDRQHLLFAIVSKNENSGVLQKPVDNTDDSNILAKTFQSWYKTANAAYNQFNLYACVTSLI